MAENTTAIIKHGSGAYGSFKALLYDDTIQSQLELVKPAWFSLDRLLRVVLSEATKNPLLYKCSQESILKALMACSQLGLEPIMGRAYLIPYKNNKKINGQWVKVYEAQFQTGYQGLIDLARRSGAVKDVCAKVVYENDFFDYSFGTERKIDHKPLLVGDRGKPVAAYAIWYLADGDIHPEIMTIEEIYKRRDASQAYQRAVANPNDKGAQKTPWVQWPDDMKIKTVIRYSSKQVPASIDFLKAIELDDINTNGAPPRLAQETGSMFTPPEEAQTPQEPPAQVAQEKPPAPQDNKQGNKQVNKQAQAPQEEPPAPTETLSPQVIKAFDTAIENSLKIPAKIARFNNWLKRSADVSQKTVDEFKAYLIRNDLMGSCLDSFERIDPGPGPEPPLPPSPRTIHNSDLPPSEPPPGYPGKPPEEPEPESLPLSHPFHPNQWQAGRKGNYAKGTGLLAYIETHVDKLAEIPLEIFTALDDKYRKIYKAPLPYDPDGNPLDGIQKPTDNQPAPQEAQETPQAAAPAPAPGEEQAPGNQPSPQEIDEAPGDPPVSKNPYARLLELETEQREIFNMVIGDRANLDLMPLEQMEAAIEKIERAVVEMQAFSETPGA